MRGTAEITDRSRTRMIFSGLHNPNSNPWQVVKSSQVDADFLLLADQP
jgi:hypothetical protein